MVALPIGERPEPSRAMAALAAGDAVAIALFVAAGEVRHAGTVAAGAETFAQFAVGWVVAALLLGAYTRRAVSTPRYAAGVAVAAWIVAALIGQGVRIVTEASAGLSIPFVLVSIGAGGVLLAVWRAVAVSWIAGD